MNILQPLNSSTYQAHCCNMLLHSSHNNHHGHFASTTRMQRTSHPSRKLQMMPAGKPSCLGITWCASCSQHLRLSNRHQVGVSWHWPWPQTLLGHVFLSFSPKKTPWCVVDTVLGSSMWQVFAPGRAPYPGERLEIGDESMDNAKTSKTFELDNRLPVMVGRCGQASLLGDRFSRIFSILSCGPRKLTYRYRADISCHYLL